MDEQISVRSARRQGIYYFHKFQKIHSSSKKVENLKNQKHFCNCDVMHADFLFLDISVSRHRQLQNFWMALINSMDFSLWLTQKQSQKMSVTNWSQEMNEELYRNYLKVLQIVLLIFFMRFFFQLRHLMLFYVFLSSMQLQVFFKQIFQRVKKRK